VWTRDLDWSALVVIGMLGALTGLVAALVPAWSIGRLTPVEPLAGRFAVSNKEAHAHRGAFWLTGAGVLVLAVSGLWLSRDFATTATGQSTLQPSPLPIALGGLGLLMLIVGVVWMAPYAVRRIAALGRLLPLTGRHAFRDAARHRFRTAAAAVTLTVTTGALVLGTFALGSAAAVQQDDNSLPPHSVYADVENTIRQPTTDTVTDLTTTLEQILGLVHMHTLSLAFSRPGVRNVDVRLLFANHRGSTGLWTLDEETLRWLVAPEDIDAALATYRAGGVVSGLGFGSGDAARIRVDTGHRRDREVWTLPAVLVTTRSPHGLSGAWISPATAAAHDLDTRPSGVVAVADREVTSEDLTALAVRGISAYSTDPLSAQTRWQTLEALGLGGLLTALVAGVGVALAAAEGRSDMATLAAIGASPRRRRMLGAGHGLFLGLTGTALGLLIGLPAGLSLTQLDGLEGVQIPWQAAGVTVLLVPLVAAFAGWVVTPTRLTLVRRGG
jgi:putative ABC transport system permease protein